MRYQDSARVSSAEVICVLNDVECTEFKSTSHTNNRECFISVESNQIIKVNLELERLHDECQADLIVDGILRDTTNWRKNSYLKRYHTFEYGTWKGGRRTYRSPLKLAELPPGLSDLFDPAAVQTTVGTIEVRIFKANPNFTHQNKVPDYNDQHNWEDSDLMAGTAGIEPTHKIVPSALKSLSESKRKTLRSNFARERLGFAPWAVFRFLYRGQKSLNDAGVLTAYPVSPIPTNAELSDEEQLESEEENPENDETKPTGDLRAVSESQITDAAIVGRDSTGSIAVQDPSASGLANALDEDERDIIASVEEAPLQDMLIAPVTQTSLLIAKQSPIRDTSRSLKPMSPVTLVDSDQDVENSTLHLLKAFENPGGSDHVPDGLVSDEISAINETQAIRGLGLGLGGPRQYTGAPAPSAADKPGTPLTEQIETEGAVVFLAPPETSGPSIRNTKILFSNAEILPVDIKPSPRQSISRPWSFPSYELRDPQSSVVGDFSPSSVASPLAADNDADEGRDSPLFVSPGPQEGLKSGSVLGSGTPPTSPVKLTSNFNSGSLAPTPRTPNALKRSFGSLKLTGEEQQTFPRFDDSIEAIKRRKVDIKALKAELKRLAETKVDSARRVEEARRKREEHERTLNERYEALERQRLEVLKSIAADHDAEKEYLQGIEDESE